MGEEKIDYKFLMSPDIRMGIINADQKEFLIKLVRLYNISKEKTSSGILCIKTNVLLNYVNNKTMLHDYLKKLRNNNLIFHYVKQRSNLHYLYINIEFLIHIFNEYVKLDSIVKMCNQYKVYGKNSKLYINNFENLKNEWCFKIEEQKSIFEIVSDTKIPIDEQDFKTIMKYAYDNIIKEIYYIINEKYDIKSSKNQKENYNESVIDSNIIYNESVIDYMRNYNESVIDSRVLYIYYKIIKKIIYYKLNKGVKQNMNSFLTNDIYEKYKLSKNKTFEENSKNKDFEKIKNPENSNPDILAEKLEQLGSLKEVVKNWIGAVDNKVSMRRNVFLNDFDLIILCCKYYPNSFAKYVKDLTNYNGLSPEKFLTERWKNFTKENYQNLKVEVIYRHRKFAKQHFVKFKDYNFYVRWDRGTVAKIDNIDINVVTKINDEISFNDFMNMVEDEQSKSKILEEVFR